MGGKGEDGEAVLGRPKRVSGSLLWKSTTCMIICLNELNLFYFILDFHRIICIVDTIFWKLVFFSQPVNSCYEAATNFIWVDAKVTHPSTLVLFRIEIHSNMRKLLFRFLNKMFVLCVCLACTYSLSVSACILGSGPMCVQVVYIKPQTTKVKKD